MLPPYNCAASLEEKGTTIYFAPEKWNIQCITTKKTDAFSLGLCLLILDNYLNFAENDLIRNYSSLRNPYFSPFSDCDKGKIDRTSNIYGIANKLLAYSPINRSSIYNILAEQKFIKQIYSKLIEYPFNKPFME